MEEVFIQFTLCCCRESLSFPVYISFPLGFEGGMWDLIVLVPYHCLFTLMFMLISFCIMHLFL